MPCYGGLHHNAFSRCWRILCPTRAHRALRRQLKRARAKMLRRRIRQELRAGREALSIIRLDERSFT